MSVPLGLPYQNARGATPVWVLPGVATVRGAEGPAFFSKKIPEKLAVTLRIGTAAGAIRRNAPPKGGEGRKNPEETRSKKRNPPPSGKRNRQSQPPAPPESLRSDAGQDVGRRWAEREKEPAAHEKGVLQVAGATKKAAPKKPAAPKKATTPAVLTGTVPEWANSTAIAQLLGKTTRRIQQLTQDGILETEVPPGGGARKYRTCETIQRYIAHVEQKAQEVGEGGRLAELNLKKLEAEVALKESQGSLHRLKTAIAEGKYIPAEQATEELAEFMAAFQKFAMTIPARMAGAMAGYADAITIRNAQKAIRKELETMLTAYVDAMQAEDPPEAAP